MKPACAITGGTGYVGSRLAAALAADFTMVPLGRSVGPDGIRWQLGERNNTAAELSTRAVTTLVHTAWDFRHPKPAGNWAANVDGSLRLLADARSAGVRQIVFVSSISAFDGARSEYGRSKLAVEKKVLEQGGTVIRPGLVWGERPGGMFGSLRRQTAKGGMIPAIGDGSYPQYLVHEDDLAEAVRRAAHGEFGAQVLTIAHPQAWRLRDLVARMAADQGKTVRFLPVPWRLIYTGLKTAETLGVKLGFRSDSVTSLVYQDPAPAFSKDVAVRPFL